MITKFKLYENDNISLKDLFYEINYSNVDEEEIINIIEDNNIDVNSIYKSNSILEIAANHSHYGLCVYLINHGADVNFLNSLHQTILMRTSNIEIMKLLIDAGIDLDIQSKNKKTVLLYSASYAPLTKKDLDVILLLIQSGANWIIEDGSGNTFIDYLNTPDKEFFKEKFPEKWKRYERRLKSKDFNL